MITFIAIIFAGVIGYLLGSARGFAAAVKFMGALSQEDTDPWIEAQREGAPYQ